MESVTMGGDGAAQPASQLFQFHKKQDEDRPDSDRHRKLGRLCFLQRTSSWKGKREKEHCHRGEYSEDQFAFPGHRRFPSRSGLAY
jgi:hypothetical protein